MTSEQLEEAIEAFCRQHKIRCLSICCDRYTTGNEWSVSGWRGVTYSVGDTLADFLTGLNHDPVAQQQWDEERMRAGA